MIRNYFKITWRNLQKNKVYSFLNIFGLGLGMAVTLLIGLWVFDELSYNSHFKNKASIAQIFQNQTFNGKVATGSAIPRPLEFVLREEHADKFKHIVMSSWNQPQYLAYGDKNLSITGNAMQPGVVDMLGLNIIMGDKNGLKEQNSIILSQATANALFGNENPLGKFIKVNSNFTMAVTAVYKDIPSNNTFDDLGYITTWEHYVNSQEWVKNSKDQWGNNSFQVFVQVADNTTIGQVSEAIKNVKLEKAEDGVKQYKPELFLLPMNDWYLRSNFENGVQTGGRIEYVWLFGIIGAFVLLLACINFMNLSTARSEKRAKEVGIRKSVGSQRGQLIRQFLSESLFTVILAFLVALAIVLVSLKGFNLLASKEIAFPWGNGWFWGASTVFILFTALVSGSYPALYLSSFNPVKVLKGTFKAGRLASLPRKVLVVTQFTVSVALIIGTLIIVKQIKHTKNRPVGYDKEGMVQIPVMSYDFIGKEDLMRAEFIKSGGAVEMSTSSSPTTDVWSNRSGFLWEGKPEGFQENFAWVDVSYEYPRTLGMKIIEGRDFSREFASDSNAVIINKSAADYMGLKNTVGTIIREDNTDEDALKLTIIGIAEDVIMQSPYHPVKPTWYVFDRFGSASYYNLRMNPANSVKQNLEIIERTFKKHFPNLPFQYQFIDEEYAKKFAAEERVASLAGVFAVLAILISCLGLFGLASFVAEQRTKEIGVRKVLGANISALWLLLSKDFLILVGISLLIASPLAWYFMGNWIQKFPYRTDISWWVFAVSGFGAIAITVLTVSFQAIKAASANPVKSLRTE